LKSFFGFGKRTIDKTDIITATEPARGNIPKEEKMKRITVMLAAALLTLSLSGVIRAEEAKPVEQKDSAATDSKPAKKTKKKNKKGAAEAKEKKEGTEGAAPAVKRAKKRREAAGC
jgi:hypothetical protein